MEIVRDADGNMIAVACSSPWGIGGYRIEYEGQTEWAYGFPPHQMNPHDFQPDYESCTPYEIAAWREACAAWDAAKAVESK
jgi:hypothetical protein